MAVKQCKDAAGSHDNNNMTNVVHPGSIHTTEHAF